MADLTIVFWRDIPAQVIVGKGRRAAKRSLPERFEQAVDRAAMASGARGTDDYLAEWRKVSADTDDTGRDDDIARAAAERLDRDYDQARLNALVANKGWA